MNLGYQIELLKRIKEPARNIVNKYTIVDDEIAEVIKYARQKSHPDNGGKQEDFLKYNELYKKYVK